MLPSSPPNPLDYGSAPGLSRRTVLKWIGAAALAMIIVAAIGLSWIARSREAANQARCFRLLRVLGSAFQLYANENNSHYPETINDLLRTQDVSPSFFI